MGELRLQLRRSGLALHRGLVKVNRLVQSHNKPVRNHAGEAHRYNTACERGKRAWCTRIGYAKEESQKSTTQKVFGDRCQGSHQERRDCVDCYMRYKPRPRQREPFRQSNHKRCERRPYVPVDKFDHTHEHPTDVPAVNLRHRDLLHREQQSYNRPRTRDQNPSRPSHIWCGLQQWVVRPSRRIIANLRRATLTACLISDTACHFSCGHWFFAAYCPVSRSITRKHESVGSAEARRQAVLKTASPVRWRRGAKKQRVETCIRR